jgi:hypothetical protein
MRSALIKCRVSGSAGTCSEIQSDCAISSSRSTSEAPEGPGARRHLAADAPETNHAELLPAQFRAHEALLVPDAGLHRGVGGGELTRDGQHQADGELGDADAVGAGGVHDQDAARGRGRHVHVVDAGAGTGDDAQVRSGFDQRRGDLRGTADDQRVRVGKIAGELVWFTAGAGVDGVSGGAERVGRGCG